MKLSELIIDYRKRMNISQREFSRHCDLSNSYISFLENEKNPKTGKPIIPTLDQYKKLANGMGITVQKLFELLDHDSPVDLRAVPSDETIELVQPENEDIVLLLNGFSHMPPENVRQASERNMSLYQRYKDLADHEPNLILGGHLAEYKYYDMAPIVEKVIGLFAK